MRNLMIALLIMGSFLTSPVTGLCQTLVFPHVADGLNDDGTRWSTEIDVLNASATTQHASIAFFNPDGTTRCFVLEGPAPKQYGCPIELDLPPNGMTPIIIDSAFRSLVSIRTAWALIQGTGGIKATAIFRRVEGPFDGRIISEAAFAPVSPSNSVEFFPKVTLIAPGGQTSNVVDVAYALANPDAAITATGEIQLWRQELVARASFSLAPHCQKAEFLEQTFGARTDSPLYVRIVVFQGKVSAIGLRFVGTSTAALPPQ